MAVFLNNGVVLTVSGIDLSDRVTAVTINQTFDELEVTAMGDDGHKFVKGLEASSITIDFLNDTAAGETLATLQTAFGTNAAVTVKQTSAVVSATNPLYSMLCLINNLTPVAGSVSDIGMQSVTFTVSGKVNVTVAP